jgi:SAM-dependent methyltransferase
MNETQPVYRFHPLIINAYTSVHQWIETSIQDADGYKSLTYSNLKQKLQETDWKHIAFQYYALFPAHYFKAAYTLDSIIGEEQIITWLRHRQKICILDIGCGAGAASAAFLEMVIRLKEQRTLTNEINILFIGVDPSHRAIGLYNQTMENLKSSTANLVNLNFKHVIEGFPNAINLINRYLKNELLSSQIPCLSNVLVMQLNVISPFSQFYRSCQANLEELRALGIDVDESTTENDVGLGTAEAQAYKQLIESVPVDVMHIVTIGTKNMEKQVQVGTNSEVTLEERIKEMANTLQQIVGNRHTINQINSDNHTVYFENPPNCYWREQKNVVKYNTEFYVDFQTVYSADRKEDQEWNEVISLDNLRLAWARARNNLLRESLCDETELRLFEVELNVKIQDLQEQLSAYADDVARIEEQIVYKFPKNVNVTRPRGLSRIEEEILSVAIVQRLGNKVSQLRGSSYAYRLTRQDRKDTEYLYEYYFEAYSSYINEAKASANKYHDGAVLRGDIESFYTRIFQDNLCDLLSRELTTSDRIRWLIRLLLSKELDDHEVGRGITQGSIGSGFYANVYLETVDERFGTSNEWGLKFYRYVDDMIFIIPNPDDIDDVEKVLIEELGKLGLNLNPQKTAKNNTTDFLEEVQQDQILDQLHNRYNAITDPLWMLDSTHRNLLESAYMNDERWWHNIERYRKCLRSLDLYISTTDLSRKIFKYLFNQKRRERELKKYKQVIEHVAELGATYPPISDEITEISDWGINFLAVNSEWNEDINTLRSDLIELFLSSWQSLKCLNEYNPIEYRRLERYIRFSLTKLSFLGLREIVSSIEEVLKGSFWIIRNPLNVLENIASQGFTKELDELFDHFQNLDKSVEYLKAITIRAMRFLPRVEAKEWETIVGCATSIDDSVGLVERLMATETWLYLGHKYDDFKQSQHIEAVKAALRSESALPSRLEKNYLLILGQFEPSAVREFSVNVNDPMLVSARDLALQGNPSEIFDLPELQVLRETYYSGQGPTDSEEGSP